MNLMNLINRPFSIMASGENTPADKDGPSPYVPSPVIQKICETAQAEMLAYNAPFGEYMVEHLKWTSDQLGDFILNKWSDPVLAARTRIAFSLHDWGKISGDWTITLEKQKFTDDQKKKRKLHGADGLPLLDKTLVALKLKPTDDDMLLIKDIKYFMVFHHENLKGTGPLLKKAAELPPVLRIAAIIDSVHGKMKSKLTDEIKADIASGAIDGNDKEAVMQRLIYGRVSRDSLEAIFSEMGGKKHEGEFDLDLLAEYKGHLLAQHPKPAAEQPVSQP